MAIFVATLLGGCVFPFEPLPEDPSALSNSPAASVHLSLGMPKDSDPTDDILLDHHYFVVSYNPRLKGPNWVGWRLVAADVGDTPRQNGFHADQTLAEDLYRVLPGDYLRSGFDRGHLCPSADRSADRSANRATFVMTNMHPQQRALNAGPWSRLEQRSRQLASSGSVLFVVAGGLFNSAPRTIGPGIAVPIANYKIVIITDPLATVGPSTKVIAVVLPNDSGVRGEKWEDFQTSIDDVETASGYDFLTNLSADVQHLLESRRPAPNRRSSVGHSSEPQ